MNLQEALQWVEDKCMYADVRKRMKSREVGYILYNTIHNLLDLNKELYKENEQLRNSLNELNNKDKNIVLL